MKDFAAIDFEFERSVLVKSRSVFIYSLDIR